MLYIPPSGCDFISTAKQQSGTSSSPTCCNCCSKRKAPLGVCLLQVKCHHCCWQLQSQALRVQRGADAAE